MRQTNNYNNHLFGSIRLRDVVFNKFIIGGCLSTSIRCNFIKEERWILHLNGFQRSKEEVSPQEAPARLVVVSQPRCDACLGSKEGLQCGSSGSQYRSSNRRHSGGRQCSNSSKRGEKRIWFKEEK